MRRALVVGIDDYDDAPLRGCVNDALRVSDVISKHQDGSPNFDCKLLVTPEEKITKSSLRKHAERLFAHEADVALFYFAGHGTVNSLGGILVTQDAESYDEGVSMADILTLAIDSKVREVVVVLDCCHSGAFGKIPALRNDGAVLREGISVLAGSRATQPTVEEDGGGVFTSLICDALDGGASDVLGNVTVAAVYAHVDQALGAWDQRPLFKANVSSFVPLRKNAPDVDRSVLRLLPRYFPSAYDEFALDPSYEPDAKPRNEENEKVFSQLQELRAARLVVPVGEEHMFYAAMRSKSCKLTPLGRYYRRLANGGRL